MNDTEIRRRILRTAENIVCTDRSAQYGEPENNFGVIGELWSAFINARCGAELRLDASDVGLMMALFKIGRISTAMVTKEDSYVDAAGYIACAGALDVGAEEEITEKIDALRHRREAEIGEAE